MLALYEAIAVVNSQKVFVALIFLVQREGQTQKHSLQRRGGLAVFAGRDIELRREVIWARMSHGGLLVVVSRETAQAN